MMLTILNYIFFAGGVFAFFYALLALFSRLDHLRVQKALAAAYKPETEIQTTKNSPVAEALWERTKIFLQNEQFDAALADCRQVLAINPNHAAAKRLWDHLPEPEHTSRPLGG